MAARLSSALLWDIALGFLFVNNMAKPKQRVVNTRFWIDDYISNLDPSEKLMFLYFLTNPHTDICGIYEVPLKHVYLETGLEKEVVLKILQRFDRDGKIFYENGWVAVKNFAKHQQKNPKILIGIEDGLLHAPKNLVQKMQNTPIAYDSLSKPMDSLPLSITDKEKEEDKEKDKDKDKEKELAAQNAASKQINEFIDCFKNVNPSYKKFFGNKTQRAAVARMMETIGPEKLQELLDVLPQTNGKQYAPSIVTPLQLEDKMASLINYIKTKIKDKPVIL